MNKRFIERDKATHTTCQSKTTNKNEIIVKENKKKQIDRLLLIFRIGKLDADEQDGWR